LKIKKPEKPKNLTSQGFYMGLDSHVPCPGPFKNT